MDTNKPDLWLCGDCFEQATGLLAACEDGCARPLDHAGSCLFEHDGEHCQGCGRHERLTLVESENRRDYVLQD